MEESEAIVSKRLKSSATDDELSTESSVSDGDSDYIVEDDESTSSFSDDDFIPNQKCTTSKRKRCIQSSSKKSEDDEEIPKISEYEMIRLKNIQERAALLASLGLPELKKSLLPVRKPREKKIEEPNAADSYDNNMLVSSCSFSDVSNGTDHQSTKSLNAETGMSQNESTPSIVLDCTSMSECYYESEEDFQLCLAQLRSLRYDFKAPFRPVTESWFKQLPNMSLEQKDVAKVVDGSICSIAVHPSPSCLMACAGDGSGCVAIWDVAAGECVDGIHRFMTHTSAVNCLEFAPCHPEQLYTASSDGTIKCTNLSKATFDVVYTAESDQSLNYFDFLPPSSLFIAQSRGLVSIVDIRSPLSEHLFQVCSDTIKTVNVHPFRKEYFLTACEGGEFNVWDLRYMTTLVQPCTRLPYTRSATSAFFSPVTGNSILTSSKDCYQRLYDSSSMTTTLQLKAARKYYRAPAPTYFRPSWIPGRDDCFVVSSSQYPLRIELISSNGKALHSFFSDSVLTAPTYLAVFHPTQSILLGGSECGRLCVFR